MAEHVGSNSEISGGTQLEIRSEHRLTWLSHFVVSVEHFKWKG